MSSVWGQANKLKTGTSEEKNVVPKVQKGTNDVVSKNTTQNKVKANETVMKNKDNNTNNKNTGNSNNNNNNKNKNTPLEKKFDKQHNSKDTKENNVIKAKEDNKKDTNVKESISKHPSNSTNVANQVSTNPKTTAVGISVAEQIHKEQARIIREATKAYRDKLAKKKKGIKSEIKRQNEAKERAKKVYLPYEGPTALHQACQDGNEDIVEGTIAKYPHLVNQTEKYTVSSEGAELMKPIHVSCYHCNIPATKALLEAGADPNAIDSDGTAPLHIAACIGSYELVSLLLRFGADVNIDDFKIAEHGSTPLHWAAIMGHVRVVRLLLINGAGEIPNKIGSTALHFCSSVNETLRNRVLELLYKPKALSIARPSSSSYLEVIRLLIEAGFDVNARDIKGSTPLHMATSINRVDRIQRLLEYGADPTLTCPILVTLPDGNQETQELAPHNLAELNNFMDAAEVLKL